MCASPIGGEGPCLPPGSRLERSFGNGDVADTSKLAEASIDRKKSASARLCGPDLDNDVGEVACMDRVLQGAYYFDGFVDYLTLSKIGTD